MHPISLRALVNAIALVIEIVSAIGAPVGFLIDSRSDLSDGLSFRARINASRVAQYIYTHPGLWQYQDVRLVEQIQLPPDDKEVIQQKIYTSDGNLVLSDGPSLPGPVMTRRAPITVSGSTVGHIDVAATLRVILYDTAYVALLSSFLALLIYFAVRLLPLRVLDRTLGALQKAESDLLQRTEHLHSALKNMSQGLCMYDAAGKVVIFNQRFVEMYGLPKDKVVPGMTTHELMALSFSSGVTDVDPQATLAMRDSIAREQRSGAFIQRLTDGRSISIVYRARPDGGFVVTFDDITERLAAEERVKHLAQYDALTDLPNRVTFYERMETILNHLRRSESVAVLSLDLDHFKSVNDTLGHPIGDRLLRAAADRMRSCIREEDLVARLGGDEFAIVQVPSGEGPTTNALAARLIESIGASYDIEDHQIVIGCSVGVAIAPADGNKPDTLMKNADLALYRAKADGGGAYRFFEIEMDARMQARRALELELRKAILKSEFELHYQPIVDVKTGRITSCEALIRWHHPERGMIPPLEFIPIAEETGLIVPLGDWVLRRACTDAMRWPKEVTVAVNLSPAQFKSRNLVKTVVDALAASGLPANRLELEITELVLLQETEGALAILHELRNLGIRIAMDDFGTGYSSLGYLRSFPFDKIKIDQSFIHDLPTKEDSVAIVRAVVGLSSSLGITTTAEGVETRAQLESLTSEGCNEVQGFLFSHPRSAAEVQHILDEMAPRSEAVA